MSNGFSILVIDDEPGIRDLLCLDLKGAGYRVSTASNGKEGLDLLTREPIDLVITDIRMAEMGGIQVLKDLRSQFRGPSPAVILITGHFGIELEFALALGASCLVPKPFGRHDLLEKIKRVLMPLRERWSEDSVEFGGQMSFEIEIQNLDRASQDGKFIVGWGGFFVHTPSMVPETGQKIKFDINILSPSPVRLQGGGRIVWGRSKIVDQLLPGVGIEICYFNAESIESAVGWFSEQELRSYIPNGASVSVLAKKISK